MAVHTLRFNASFHPEQTAAPADLDGRNLSDIFESWCCQNERTAELVDEAAGHFVQITNVERTRPRVVLVTTQVGSWGDPGNVVNMTTLAETATLGTDDAATTYCRTALYVPDRGEIAYLFTEYADRGNGGGRLYERFRAYFAETTEFTIKREAIMEAKTWAEGATLQSVSVRVLNYSGDRADPKSKVVGTVLHMFKPKKREYFPSDMLERIASNPNAALELVQLQELPDDPDRRAEIFVELASSKTGMKRVKKFAIGDDWGAPAVRELLCDHGDLMLPNEAFIDRCDERLSELGVRV